MQRVAHNFAADCWHHKVSRAIGLPRLAAQLNEVRRLRNEKDMFEETRFGR